MPTATTAASENPSRAEVSWGTFMTSNRCKAVGRTKDFLLIFLSGTHDEKIKISSFDIGIQTHGTPIYFRHIVCSWHLRFCKLPACICTLDIFLWLNAFHRLNTYVQNTRNSLSILAHHWPQSLSLSFFQNSLIESQFYEHRRCL